jgi:tetratricopeptide (TPR) repeat protein
MNRHLWGLAWSACCLIISGACLADSFSEGRALYKAGKYQEAVVRLEQATREDPNNAKAWWQLNFAYNKLNRYADALQAVRRAGEIDPKLSFASTPGKYAEVLSRLEQKVKRATFSRQTSGTQRRHTSTPESGIGGNITRQLLDQGANVDPGQQTQKTWVTLLLLAGGAIVVWVIVHQMATARRLTALREPLERLRSEVISQMNYLEDSISHLDEERATKVREARIAAGTKLDEASRLMVHPRRLRELTRAQTLLDQAQAILFRGRAIADGKEESLGATTPASGTEAYPHPNWSQVPENERGTCFFCSRPELLANLTPVTINLDDRPQKVLACRDDLQIIKTGQIPMIRAFNVDGRYVPWYADSRYDPYRDYYERGYDNRSLLSDMITLSLIDRMFWDWHRPAWGGSWGHTYVFYPDHEAYRDYYSQHAAASADYPRPENAAGASFLQDVGGGDSVGTSFFEEDQS